MNVAVKGNFFPLFAKESMHEAFLVGIWALSVDCEIFEFAFPVIALTFHGVPPTSVLVVACFAGGNSAVSVGVSKCTVEVTEVTVKQYLNSVLNDVPTTNAVNNMGRVAEILVIR